MNTDTEKNIQKTSNKKKSEGKKRLDILLVERGLAPSREKAKAIIMSGIVLVENVVEDKAGSTFKENANIRLRYRNNKQPMAYVSRGGYKLEKAIKEFNIILDNLICMDIGASSGGFTDCMLQNGAKKVFAVDVGTNQLDYKLRCDSRVVSMEKTNIRYFDCTTIEKVDFISVDVSFISLELVLPVVYQLLSEEGMVVALIKPQFEVGKENVGKKGVVRESKLHKFAIEKILKFAGDIGFFIKGLSFSPIKGPEGNIEFLVLLDKEKRANENFELLSEKVVREAHSSL